MPDDRAVSDASARALRDDGYVLLRSQVDAVALAEEHDRALREAFGVARFVHGSAGNRFRYVPTMCERTPMSLALIVRFASVAAELLGCAVLPSRAKATVYRGDTAWHHDTDLPVTSLGFVTYLDPLDEHTGALQVRRGSHHRDAVVDRCPIVTLASAPGDLVIFDEHLWHASRGGGERRQWRVDYVADTGDDDALRAYFAAQYSPGWDGGYDVDRFATYGPQWRQIDPHWNARLEALGAYAAAAAEEAFVRERRR